MPVPLRPEFYASVLHDADGNPIASVLVAGVRRLAVDATISGAIVVGAITIMGVDQDQVVETVVPLASGVTFTGGSRDCDKFESFGVSVFVTAGAGALNVTVAVENSSDGGVTWRPVDSVVLAGGVGASASFNRVYSVTRQHYRAKVTNNDGVNADAVTELVTMRKPI